MNITNVVSSDPMEQIDRQIVLLQHRREILGKLLSDKAALEDRLNRLMSGESETKEEGGLIGIPQKRRNFVLPRGVLTLTAFESIKSHGRPMHLKEVLEDVKDSPLIKDHAPSDLERRLRGVLQTSHQFKNIGSNTFSLKTSKLEGKLFERLAADLSSK